MSATVYTEEEVLATEPKKRPLSYRVPYGIYNFVHEKLNSVTTFDLNKIEKIILDILFTFAETLEACGITYETWPENWKLIKDVSTPPVEDNKNIKESKFPNNDYSPPTEEQWSYHVKKLTSFHSLLERATYTIERLRRRNEILESRQYVLDILNRALPHLSQEVGMEEDILHTIKEALK